MEDITQEMRDHIASLNKEDIKQYNDAKALRKK